MEEQIKIDWSVFTDEEISEQLRKFMDNYEVLKSASQNLLRQMDYIESEYKNAEAELNGRNS